jgi:DNA-binding NtrC family response regulator
MQAIRAEVEYAAGCNAKVLLTGESGVGKEVASRRIHQLSERANAPLVAINCVGIPETLLESELFGHVRGSFTGAHRDRVGLLEMAHRGTVFLDEVGEMGPRMQALLLRFLETGEIQRVGSDRVQSKLDVRVIAATNRDPLEHVEAKTFRADLYYRLNVIDITIPPLRTRREDIPVLLEHFLSRYSDQHGIPLPIVEPEAMRAIVEYEWPGNVRQLKNAAERLIVRGSKSVITIADLPSVVRGRRSGATGLDLLPREATGGLVPGTLVDEPPCQTVVDLMFDRMVKQRESFWSIVYSAYMVRDLTRTDLRAIITRGLQETAGNYKMLVELFNMERTDYKRFLNFLRKQECQVPFAHFRAVSSWHRDVPDAGYKPTRSTSNSQLRH